LLLTTRHGLAQESAASLELDWRVPAGCPSRAEVRLEVLRLVGSTAPPGRRLGARVTVIRSGAERWTLTLRTLLDGAPGERVLSGRSCRAVTDAAVLTLALTLNPELTLSNPQPQGEGPPPPATPPPTESKPASPETTETGGHARRESQTEWLARTLVGVRVGTLPDPDPELGVGVGLGLSRVTAWLLASYAPPEHVVSQAKRGAGATLWMQSTAALGCYSLASDPISIAPCAGLELTRVQGNGYGVSHPRQGGVVYWLSPALGVAAGLRLHRRLRLRLEGLGLAAVKRPAATLRPWGDLYRPEPLAARVCLGVEIAIP
jgi:hypothetical protein